MALRGETIGRAYVKILADGTGLPASIKDEMEKSEPVMEASGRRDSKAYKKGFKDELKGTGRDSIRNALNEGIGRSDAIENYFGSSKWKQQLKRLDSEFGDVGVLIGHNIEQGVRDSGDLGGVERRLKNITSEIRTANRQIEAATSKQATEFEKKWRASFLALSRDGERTAREIGRVMDEFSRQKGDRDNFFTRFSRDMDNTAKKAHIQLANLENFFTRVGNAADRGGNKIGKVFGKGSRNDLVNFFSSFVQAPVEIIGKVAQGLGQLVDVGSRMQQAFGKGDTVFSGLLGASKELTPLATNVLGIAGALGGLVLILGPVAGLLSGVAAAIVALASAVSFALAAGVGVLAGLMAPLAFGIGTVALAFMGLTDDMKKGLKESLKGAIDQFHELQDVAAKGIVKGLQDAGPDIEGVFKKITPLIEGVSEAIGNVIEDVAAAANSPGFKRFADFFRVVAFQAITSLGHIITNVFGGIGGLLEGLAPFTQSFLDWIERITGKFSEWANSAGGQSAIQDFMARASESAQQLWDLIKKVGEALGKVLFNEDARQGGGDLLESLTGQVQRFIDYLDAHPGAIKKWIGDGVDIARNVARAVGGIVEIFDKLDTPENRKMASQIFGALATALHIAAGAAGAVSGALKHFNNILDAVPFATTIKGIFNIISKVRDLMPALRNAAGAVGRFAQGLWQDIKHAVQVAGQWLADLPGKARAQVGRMASAGAALANSLITGLRTLISKAGSLVTELIGKFAGLGARIVRAIGNIQIHINWPSPPGFLKGLIPGTASGGLIVGPQVRMVGEAGPEAVVPLSRPLNQVDPAVRALSAIAQGKGDSISNDTSKKVDVGGITIITPTKDPAAVARETVNRLVAAAYI